VKNNGDIVAFVKQKDYVMVNNDLGSGSFGQTVLLKDPFIDELFVAKKYEPYYESDRKEFFDSFLQEIKIMYKLNHKNVVRVFSYYPFESLYTGYILMEYIDGKRIDEYLDDPSLWAKGVDPDTIF
jgi:serine/threonine protein kinase